jgi:hypothetical protein
VTQKKKKIISDFAHPAVFELCSTFFFSLFHILLTEVEEISFLDFSTGTTLEE